MVLIFVTSGCASHKPFFQVHLEDDMVLEGTPYFPQQSYQCGPAALAMLLGASGVITDPEALAPQTYLPGRKGSLQLELVAASRQNNRIPYIIDPDFSSLVGELLAGRPVLVLQNLGLNVLPAYHYAVVIGLLPPNDIVLRSGENERLVMELEDFLVSWERSNSWGMIVLRPGEMPYNPDPVRYLNAVNGFELAGNHLNANEAYLAARTAWPENQTALFGLGNNFLYLAEYREAARAFRELLKSNPNHVAALNNLAESLVRQGCYGQASVVINQAMLAADKINSPHKQSVLRTREEITHNRHQAGQVSDKDCNSQP